ncbi:MAG: SDR family oxidoreductase [Candidatus Hodarchaeales archaeon]
MDLKLEGKNALIYASSKGLGFGIALNLAREGCNVIICSRNFKRLTYAKKSLQEQCPGVKVVTRVLDLEKENEVQEMLDWAIDEFERIDILITNAGGPPTRPVVDLELEDWNKAIEGILRPVVIAFKKIIPHMISNGGGRIITLTSLTVKQPLVNFALSNTLRAGIAGLVKTAANEHAKDNVLINNVCPGYTKTERIQEIVSTSAQRRNMSEKEVLLEIENRIPMNRMGTVDEIASVVVFLSSTRASYITGQTITIDGGYSQGLL